jgi:hypothetical protein
MPVLVVLVEVLVQVIDLLVGHSTSAQMGGKKKEREKSVKSRRSGSSPSQGNDSTETLIFFDVEDQTQGFAHSRQALCHRAPSPALVL